MMEEHNTQLMLPEHDYADLMKNLHILSGLHITIFDMQRCHYASCPLTACSFCILVRKNSRVCDLCKASDKIAFENCLKKDGRVYAYRCSMGLYEAVAPLYYQGLLSGYIMMGQGVMDDRTEKEQVLKNAHPYVDSEALLRQTLEEIPLLSREKWEANIQMLEIFSSYISTNNLLPILNNGLAFCIQQYINDHLGEHFSNSELCHIFHCSSKTLTDSFRKAYNMTIVQYTNDMRLKKAKEILKKNPNLSIGIVALSCGFTDQGYFCKLFQKKYSLTPIEMKRKYHKKQNS